MTPERFRISVAAIGWTLRGLADLLGCDDRLPRRWASGEANVPPSVGEWLDRLAKAHERHPPPQDWRKRATPTP